jgi:hypothetical protein
MAQAREATSSRSCRNSPPKSSPACSPTRPSSRSGDLPHQRQPGQATAKSQIRLSLSRH